MPPTRPVDGAATETEWGQAVHDAVFTPRGVRASSGGVSVATGTTFEQLQLDTAIDDPGGWIDAGGDAIELPTGATGQYLWSLRLVSDNGQAGDYTRWALRVNGVNVATGQEAQQGTTAVFPNSSGLLYLNAGDVLTVYAAKTGGTDPDVEVRELSLVRHGEEMGA